MHRIHRMFIFAAYFLVVASIALGDDWVRFRGPNGSGVSEGTVPMRWSDSENLQWKSELPGPGSSSPIVKGDRVYVTCYTGYGIDQESPGDVENLQRHLLCFDRKNGKEIWRATVGSSGNEDPYKGFITEHGYASSTPVTDGQRIFVLFDKSGVVALDMDGNKQWQTNVGTESDPYQWGGGSSTILYNDYVIVNAANVGHAIVALHASDGSVAWKYGDNELTNCWSTPILVSANGRDELVLGVPKRILALDPNTGDELWFAESPIKETMCGSLVQHDGAVFAMGGRGGNAIGVKYGGSGDVTETHTLWVEKLRAGIGTPVVKDGKMYWTSTGLAHCASCENGKYVFKERMTSAASEQADGGRRRPTGNYASAIAVGDNILLLTRSGTIHVLRAGDSYQPLAENSLENDPGPFNATPAVSDGAIFLRSNQALYCIAAPESR
jgi:outer membrane protein assembly factor BamB